MPTDRSKQEDPIKLAIQNNPCGKCRANGIPICINRHSPGGGSGSGGGGGDKETKKEDNYSLDSLKNMPGLTPQAQEHNQKFLDAIEKDPYMLLLEDKIKALLLNQEKQWQKTGENVFTFANDQNALWSIELDLNKNSLSFRGNEGLLNNDKNYQVFLQALKDILSFAEQILGKDNPSLSIKNDGMIMTLTMDDSRQFQQLMKAMFEHNILPTPSRELQQRLDVKPNVTEESVKRPPAERDKSADLYSSPFKNPFDTDYEP